MSRWPTAYALVAEVHLMNTGWALVNKDLVEAYSNLGYIQNEVSKHEY